MIIQFCGMSGSGKTTLAQIMKSTFGEKGIAVEVIDGDEYRKALCADLGFSKEDRNRNIRRLAFVANKLSQYHVIAIICAINPYEAIRNEVKEMYAGVHTVFIDCDLDTLVQRDTKGLYRKAMLPDGHPEKLDNLTGVNDPFEAPQNPDLVIKSGRETIAASAEKLAAYITQCMINAPQVL